MKELKLNRCFSNIPLIYEFYGTGHIIYKNHIFYHHNGEKEIIVYNIVDSSNIEIIAAPDDGVCCDTNDSLYKMKHSGMFHFQVDENGLWLIYALKTSLTIFLNASLSWHLLIYIF